jgi:hypothetical protein
MSLLPAANPTPPVSSSSVAAALRPARCPRCGAGFECGAALPASAPCACAGVGLTPEQRATLRGLYEGCLCLGCLGAIARGESADAPGDAR